MRFFHSPRDFAKWFLARHPAFYRALLKAGGKPSNKFETQIYLSCVANGQTVVEVGANQGFFTRIMSDMVGRAGRVVSFEPVPPTFAILSESLRHAPYDNVSLCFAAASDTPGRMQIHVPGGDDGQASLKAHAMASWERSSERTTYECDVCRVDDILPELSPPVASVDFFKIDVEGAELLVLRGAEQTIRTSLPIIHLELCEAWTQDFGYRPHDIYEYLRGLGYTDFYLCDGGLERVTDASRQLAAENLPVSTNMLCMSEARPAPKFFSSLSGK